MSFFEKITTGVQPVPLLALLYGPPGIGKSTFAATAPAPLFLPTEFGTHQLNVARLPEPKTLDDALAQLREFRGARHAYQTLVIDGLGGIQTLVYKHVCENPPDGKAKRASIEDFGYGKGYVWALDQWDRLLVELEEIRRTRRTHILLLAHETLRRMPHPAGADYDQRVPDVYKETVNKLVRWVDNVFFATYKIGVVVAEGARDKGRGKGVSTGARLLRTAWRPDATAKNRFNLPFELPLDFPTLFDAIAASGAVGDAVAQFATEARDLAPLAGDDDASARCLAKIELLQQAGNLAGLQQIVNFLRARSTVDAVTA